MSEFRVITSDYVKVNVTNSQNSAVSLEQKFAKSLAIEELKVYILFTMNESLQAVG